MDIGLFRGVLTAVVMLLFIGLCLRSFSRRRRTEYKEAERLPLEDGDQPPVPNDAATTGQQSTRERIHE